MTTLFYARCVRLMTERVGQKKACEFVAIFFLLLSVKSGCMGTGGNSKISTVRSSDARRASTVCSEGEAGGKGFF